MGRRLPARIGGPIAPILVHSMCTLVHFAVTLTSAPDRQCQLDVVLSYCLSITYGLLEPKPKGSPIWLGKCFISKY